MTEAEIPAALAKAYLSAKPEVKDLADHVAASVQKKDYPEAFAEVQNLCNATGETKDQRMLAARVMLSITGLLQAAQNQGDAQAAAALKTYQMTK